MEDQGRLWQRNEATELEWAPQETSLIYNWPTENPSPSISQRDKREIEGIRLCPRWKRKARFLEQN